MRYLNYLVLLVLISCSSGERRLSVDETAYQTSGVERFFLPEMPNWANYSEQGQCFKSNSIHYLDFSKLVSAYQLRYEQMVELQAQYNQRLEDYYRSAAVKFLKPIEEAGLFSNTLEQVRSGIKLLKIPVGVGQVEIIWLESFLRHGKVSELKKLAKSGRFDERLPILFSSCLSKQSMDQWLVENDLEDTGFYTLTSEWLSPYGEDFVLHPGLKLYLKDVLGSSVKVHFYSYNQLVPAELILP